MNTKHRTSHKSFTLRILSILLAVMAIGLAGVLLLNAFRNDKTTAWQLLIVNAFAQNMFDTIASSIDEWS